MDGTPHLARPGEGTAAKRRRLVPADRRAELVAAAIRILSRAEPQANWVSAVTREAGASKGTFYVYFPSWEHMLAEVRRQIGWRASQPIVEALASTGAVDWWAVLERECVRFVEVALEFKAHHGLVFHSDLPVEMDPAPPSGAALLLSALERGIEQGIFRSVDAEAASELLFAVMHAACDAVLAGGEPARWIDASLEVARGLLSPPAATTGDRR